MALDGSGTLADASIYAPDRISSRGEGDSRIVSQGGMLRSKGTVNRFTQMDEDRINLK